MKKVIMKKKRIIAITLIFSILFCSGAQSVAQAQSTDAGITRLYQNFIELAERSFERGDYAQARDYYQAALELNPDNAEYLNSKIAGAAEAERRHQETQGTIFATVEQAPEFPGGQAAMMRWISDNLRYPTIAQESGIQGRVTLQFVVNADGSIVDIQVVRGVDPSLDREAVRVVQAMPRWIPGRQDGNAVRTRFTLPMNFRL